MGFIGSSAIGKKQSIRYYRIFKKYLQILVKNGNSEYQKTIQDLDNMMYKMNNNSYESKYKKLNDY